MEENKNENSSNIDVLWLKAIYEDLRNLEQHIILAKNGFNNMEEIVSLQGEEITEIQLRNLKLTTTKFLSILDNVQTKVTETFFKETKKALKIIEKIIRHEELNQNEPYHFKHRHNDPKHQRWRELTNNFHTTINDIDDKKAKLIKELDPLLYFIQEGSSLDKTKQIKLRK